MLAVNRLGVKAGLMAALLFVLAGCAAIIVSHGYAPTEAELKAIKVGVDDKASVEQAIGRPGATGVIGDDIWYYMSSKVRNYTYKAPKVIDRQLVAIRFDKNGRVANIERFTLKDGRVIALNRRVTDTGIKGVSFIGQMLGNIGNVNLSDQPPPQ